jgi:hypothetical protein
MPDLLEAPTTKDPKATPPFDMGPMLNLLQSIAISMRKVHPTQRAIVKLANGAYNFTTSQSVRIEFYGHGNAHIKSQLTYISNNTDADVYISWDGPVEVQAPAINGHILPGGGWLTIPTEIPYLYLYGIDPVGGPITLQLNNSDMDGPNPSGTPLQVIRIDAFTNPEDTFDNDKGA